MEIAILSSAYFGPVQWYQKLNRYDRCLIEQYDHFIKQTYRNRCIIMTTQGPQSLTIPIEKFEDLKCPMKDVKISDHGNWKHLHWNALMSAYGESPFFEFYADDIRPFFEKQWKYLYDFNWDITEKVCELLDVRPHIEPTNEYLAACRHDFRDVIRPKHPLPDEDFHPQPYYQVYGQKYGFVANLSILDLLFNEGNEAIFYL